MAHMSFPGAYWIRFDCAGVDIPFMLPVMMTLSQSWHHMAVVGLTEVRDARPPKERRKQMPDSVDSILVDAILCVHPATAEAGQSCACLERSLLEQQLTQVTSGVAEIHLSDSAAPMSTHSEGCRKCCVAHARSAGHLSRSTNRRHLFDFVASLFPRRRERAPQWVADGCSLSVPLQSNAVPRYAVLQCQGFFLPQRRPYREVCTVW